MITIHPFQALMPPPEQAAAVAAVPYDVVNTAEAAALADGNPLSFLRVSRPEIELPPETNIYDDVVYERAVANFSRLREAAPLNQDPHPSLYVYSLVMDGRRQTGLVVAASVDDYDADRIKKHEKTRRDKEDDRTRHTVRLRAHTGPVFLTCRDTAGITDTMDSVRQQPPLFDVTAVDGVRHQVWRVPSAMTAQFQDAFKTIPALYVADGHHRAKSASRAREACRAANSEHDGSEAYNRFLAVVFPGEQLNILAYNRVVHDRLGLSAVDLLSRIQSDFDVVTDVSGTPSVSGEIHMYLDGRWYGLTSRHAPSSTSVVDCLDVSILQNTVLSPLLGIDDPRTSQRIDFVGGIHGTERLMAMVDARPDAVAFSLYPVTVEQLMAIADAGMIMPPKSTWFEPKLRDGLLGHLF